jgi:hypothetical protein
MIKTMYKHIIKFLVNHILNIILYGIFILIAFLGFIFIDDLMIKILFEVCIFTYFAILYILKNTNYNHLNQNIYIRDSETICSTNSSQSSNVPMLE